MHLLALVHSHLQGGNFLFSYEWDITRRLQAQSEDDEDSILWKKVRGYRIPLSHTLEAYTNPPIHRRTSDSSGIGMCQINHVFELHLDSRCRYVQTRLIDASRRSYQNDVCVIIRS